MTTVGSEPRRRARQGIPDLLYGETETELRAAVRGLLTDRAAWRDVLARTETGQTYDDKLWHTLAAEVGCAGLLIPEEHGGAGASFREAAVVAEELGRAALAAGAGPEVHSRLTHSAFSHRGRSFHGPVSTLASLGSPSTRSAMMLRKISEVPPSIELPRARRNRYPGSRP